MTSRFIRRRSGAGSTALCELRGHECDGGCRARAHHDRVVDQVLLAAPAHY